MSSRSSSGTHTSNQNRKQIKYVYQLPYCERNELCLCLDMNNKWKELGGKFLKFDYGTLYRFEMSAVRRSPTENLLCEWGSQDGTILKLFAYLCKMKHFQAMRILKPFVDPKYHYYIKDEDDEPSFTFDNDHTLRQNFSQLNLPNAPNPSRASTRQPPNSPAVSQCSQRRSEPCSGDTPVHLETNLPQLPVDTCTLHISYKELEKATNYWDETLTLGKGGFGVVYKGSWKNTPVAVKRLESKKSNDPRCNPAEVQRQQSLRELKYLNNYKHDNILPLYGYSIDGEKPCLIYQFMSNGSLEDRLRCRQGTKVLSWWQRANIANGSARGLQFLHSMEVPLIHGDIKSANILLDSNFVPKIGDFGLAKEGPIRDITHVEITKVQGTRPYLPHEFLRGKKLSVKVDTYGFGVVLCELATGLRAYDESRKDRFLRDHCDEAENLIKLKDPKVGPPEDDYFYTSLIKLGIQCTNDTARNRPLMADVLKELDTVIENGKLLVDGRSSLLPGSFSYLITNLVYPSSPTSKQPISILPSPMSHLPPQVVEKIPKEYERVFNEQKRISLARVIPCTSAQNQNIDLVATHSPDRNLEAQISPKINVRFFVHQPGGDTESTEGTSISEAENFRYCGDLSEDDTEIGVPIPIVSALEN